MKEGTSLTLKKLEAKKKQEKDRLVNYYYGQSRSRDFKFDHWRDELDEKNIQRIELNCNCRHVMDYFKYQKLSNKTITC